MINNVKEVLKCVYSFSDAYVTGYRFHDTLGDVFVNCNIGDYKYQLFVLVRPDSFELKYPGGMTDRCMYKNLSDTFKVAIESCKPEYFDDNDYYDEDELCIRKDIDEKSIMDSIDAASFILPVFKKYTSKTVGISFDGETLNEISISIPRTSSCVDFDGLFSTSNPNNAWFWYSVDTNMMYHSLNNNRTCPHYTVDVKNNFKSCEDLLIKRFDFDKKVEQARYIQDIREF